MSFKQFAKLFDAPLAIVVGAVAAVLIVQQFLAVDWTADRGDTQRSGTEATTPRQPKGLAQSASALPGCIDPALLAAQADCLAEAVRPGNLLR